jgi:hypothetical protein
MSDSSLTAEIMAKNAANRAERRRFLRNAGVAGIAGLGALGASHLAAPSAFAQGAITDIDIFNFALNLEYLEAEFYVRAVFGRGLADADTSGTVGTPGPVVGGRAVPFATEAVRQYATEIAGDEEAHVRFFRQALGANRIARPAINIDGGTADAPGAFTLAARAAGVIGSNQVFDPYADENSFLLAAFIFEDVGVTAFKGASPLISDRTNLENAAGVLAVEAYHAGLIRTVLFARGLGAPANRISDARDALDNPVDVDQGIIVNGVANIVPTDANGIAFSRTPGDVLNIVFLNAGATDRGGFFPNGVNNTNSALRMSSAS